MINEQFEKAVTFAARAHRNQVRKGTDTPYIIHPYMVACILWQQQCAQHVVIAGLLHDTLEDTDVDLKEIKTTFGDKIAHIVNECTEPDKKLPWRVRKQHTIERVRTASTEVKCVICADKLHNLYSLEKSRKELGVTMWQHFNSNYQSQKWYMQSMVKSLFERLAPEDKLSMFNELDRRVQEFFTSR